MRIKSLLLMASLVLGFSGSLHGEEKFGFEIGAFAGSSIWKERNFQVGPPQASPPIDLKYKYDDKVVYGARFNLMSRGHWGGEFSYSYQRNTLTLSRESAPSISPVELKGGIHHFFYNMIYYPLRYEKSKIIPFVTGGIGLAGYQLDNSAIAKAADPDGYAIGALKNIDKRFAYNYGVGIKGNLTPRIGVRGDFRHIFSDVPSYGLPKESANPVQTVLPIQGKLQSYEASIGIYFHISSGLKF